MSATQPDDHSPAPEHPPLRDVLRYYRFTAIYLVVTVTIVLGLLVWDRAFGTATPYCIPQTAAIEESTHD